jgi:hypothetical protein
MKYFPVLFALMLFAGVACGNKGGANENSDSSATDNAATPPASTAPTLPELKTKLAGWAPEGYTAGTDNLSSTTYTLSLKPAAAAKAGEVTITVGDYPNEAAAVSDGRKLVPGYEFMDEAKAALVAANAGLTLVNNKTKSLNNGKVVLVFHGEKGAEKMVFIRRLVRDGQRVLLLQVRIEAKAGDYTNAEEVGYKVMEHLMAQLAG